MKTATVTLVTGDVVTLSTYPDGRQSAGVTPGPASGHGSFQTVQHDGHLSVIPDVAGPYLASGLLDERLFDVTELAAQGYDDAHAKALPLILEYDANPVNATATRKLLAQPMPAGAQKSRDLASVGSVAVTVQRGRSTQFWQAVDDNRAAVSARVKPALDRHLRKIWLDGKAKASLDVSVPLIGAPTAWQAGFDGKGVTVAVLDTGVDATHPDLTDRVTEQVNFSDAKDAVDHFGHGTHVASTVAGSGAASGGKYKGVAPGAKILSGKVLNDSGSGLDSWIITGMEWAAKNAKVVSMSLGGGATDGTDPLSQAVNRLSAQYGTLFVIAAGNSGILGAETVATPGAADAALTVAASGKTDVLAYFSSRGPRTGDHALKPEITGPGVSIVAARAAGTFPEIPAGDKYVGMSGTSMATPHVSGAAAIIAQEHPDWTGEQIKALLTGTAKQLSAGTVYDQGAGRLDVGRAATQKLTASAGVLSLGHFNGPYGNTDPVRRTVTYRNDGAADLVLDLAVSATTTPGGAAAPPDMLNVSPATLTVPAGGTATATVSLDPDFGVQGIYSGRLTATARDGKTALAAAVGFDKDQQYKLTFRAIGRDGNVAKLARISLWNLDTNKYQVLYANGAPVSMSTRAAQFQVFGGVATMDEAGATPIDLTAVVKPDVTVNADTEVVLDARGGKPVNVRTPRPTAQVSATHELVRNVPGTGTLILGVGTGETGTMYVVPSEKAVRGTMEYTYKSVREVAPITMNVAGADVALHPLYLTYSSDVAPRLDGHRKLPAVFAGAGRPDDYDGRDVRGKVALVRSTAGLAIEDQVKAAADAKAAMVLVLASAPGVFQPYVKPSVPLPTLGLSQAEGRDLLRRLGQGKVSLDMTGTPYSPYRYQAVLPSPQVPNGIEYAMDATNTALMHAKVYAVQPNEIGAYTNDMFRPLNPISIALVYRRPFPFEQDKYYTANDTQYGQTYYANYPYDGMVGTYGTLAPGAEVTKTWFRGPLRAGPSILRTPTSRQGDRFFMGFDSMIDSEPDHVNGQQGTRTAARVYRNGALVAENRYAVGYFDVGVAEPATYRVELDMDEGRPGWRIGTESHSAWTFRSARPTAPGWPSVDAVTAVWDLALDLNNAAPAGQSFPVKLNVGHQPGAQAIPIKTVKAWASYDDGGTWKKIPVFVAADGSYVGSVKHPKLNDTTGFVALRFDVTDEAGGRFEQTLYRAYALR
jgi:subtilisin family serine protease